MRKVTLIILFVLIGLASISAAHATTYFDTTSLFSSTSTPTQDLVAVNPQGAFDYIRVGPLTQPISSKDLYVTFSVPIANSCNRLNTFGASGGSFPVNFFVQPFTGADLQTPLTGNSVDTNFGIRTLPDGTCVAKFDQIDLSSGSYIILAFGLLPQFADRPNPWPLTVTASGTWESVPPFCPSGTGINNCVVYSGTPYVVVSDVDPFPEAPTIAAGTLAQLKSDGVTAISEGATTTQNIIVFQGVPQSPSSDPLQVEIELATSTANFTGTPSAVSTSTQSGSTTTVTVTGLADGTYFWRARAVDTVTNSASNWQMFGTGATPDFTVHQVPLYTQSDLRWDGDIYANGRGNIPDPNNPTDKPCGQDILHCGCAITSIVMVAHYYGINNGIDGTPITPLSLDAYLDSHDGYTAFGDVNWSVPADYANDSLAGLKLQHPTVIAASTDGATLDSPLNQYLRVLEPAILHNDSVGHFFVADDQLATTYSIKDPAFFLTKTLHDNAPSTSTTAHDYGNKFNSIHLYTAVPESTAMTQDIYITMSSPAELLITDPNGNMLGVNPISDTTYNQINGAVYSSEGISDGTLANPGSGHETKFAWIPAPVSGQYNVQAIGTGSGSYTLQTVSHDVNGTVHSQTATGNVVPNVSVPYTFNFAPQQPQVISLVPQDTTPPVISHSSVTSQYLLNASSIQFTFNATDTGVGVFSVTSTLDGVAISSPATLAFGQAQLGNHALVITAQDFAGNATSTTLAYSVVYNFDGFFPPVKTDGSGIYKQGRTLPVKFQLTDANGQFVSTAVAHLFVAKIQDSIVGSDNVALSTSAADSGNTFRYDSTANQYIFNLDTGTLTPGTWQLKAMLDDGTNHTVVISIKS